MFNKSILIKRIHINKINKDFKFWLHITLLSRSRYIVKMSMVKYYFVNLTIVGDKLDDTGFLVNFSHLKKMIHGKFDHQLLNNLPAF